MKKSVTKKKKINKIKNNEKLESNFKQFDKIVSKLEPAIVQDLENNIKNLEINDKKAYKVPLERSDNVTKKTIKNSVNPTIQTGFFKKKHDIPLNSKSRKILKKYPDKAFLVTMLFCNGTKKEFIFSNEQNYFIMDNKKYIIHYEESFYDLSLKMYNLIYHEDFPLPINREIITTGEEQFFSITPHNIKKYMEMDYVKKILSGEEIDKIMKIILVVTCANLIGMIILGITLYRMAKGG